MSSVSIETDPVKPSRDLKSNCDVKSCDVKSCDVKPSRDIKTDPRPRTRPPISKPTPDLNPDSRPQTRAATEGSDPWPCGPPKTMQTRKCADAMGSMACGASSTERSPPSKTRNLCQIAPGQFCRGINNRLLVGGRGGLILESAAGGSAVVWEGCRTADAKLAHPVN